MSKRTQDPRFYVEIARINEKERTVEGYVTANTADSYGAVVDLDSMRACLPEFSAENSLREMHRPLAAGTVEGGTHDKGLQIVARIVDDGAWRKVKSKVYRGLSIQGKKD